MLKMCEQLSCEDELWPLLLSSAAREAIVKEKKFELISAVRENESYFEKWYKNRVFLDNLRRFNVDTQKIRNVSKIRSGSMASKTRNENKIVYSTSRTATGRLTITQGLNFLVLPKETRKCILPSILLHSNRVWPSGQPLKASLEKTFMRKSCKCAI